MARVVEAAGVSRATFYEHFRNKEECFLAAYRDITQAMRSKVRAATERSTASNRPRAALETLFAGIAADPASAKLVLVEALAGTAAIRAEHEQLIADAEVATERFLAEHQHDAPAHQISAAALLGGMAGTLSLRVLAGEGAAAQNLLGPLATWLDSYALPPGQRRWEAARWDQLGRGFRRTLAGNDEREPVSLLPRGKGSLPAAQAAHQRRQRLLDATVRLTRERGYAGLSVADIAAAARVSRGVFYAQFQSKEDAFLAVHKQDTPVIVPFTNGSGVTPSTVTFTDTVIGHSIFGKSAISITGTFNVTTSTGGLLTLI